MDRKMDAVSFWKTFNLCKELSLAGSFIYNGLKVFDDMESFEYEEEIFEFLYNISIGIERLEKIVLILQEDIKNEMIEKFEQSLITHNHMELMKRIKNKKEKQLASVHNRFLQILCEFYNSWRYDRYSVSDYRNYDKEKQALISFIEKYLHIKITSEFLQVTQNDIRIKKFIGRTVGKIVDYLYKRIVEESGREGVFTYEVRINTKAYKIFMRKEYDFISEDILWKEVLLYALQNVNEDKYLNLYNGLSHLDFDSSDLVHLIHALKNDVLKIEHLGMLDEIYENIENKQERFKYLDTIGNANIIIDSEEIEDAEFDEQE